MIRILSRGLASAVVVASGWGQSSSQESVRQSIEQAQQRIQELQSRPLVRVRGADDMPPPPARLPVCFSPEPPPPGGLIDRVSPLYALTWNAPLELAAFVNEPFYIPLSTMIAEKNLSGRQRRRIDAFVSQRTAAIDQLKAQLAGSSVPAGRPAASSAVEDEAEALRRLYCDNDTRWGRYRTYRVSTSDDGTPPALVRYRQYHVLRAAAFHDPGLSPGQRRLLVELSYDLQSGKAVAELAVPKSTAGAAVFFLPESARIYVPDALPADLAADLNAFLATKHQLKIEIAQEVLRTDGETEGKRERALSTLARRHGPLIEALEQKAEAIRAGFAPLTPPAPITLPDNISALALAFRTRRNELQDELIRRLDATRKRILTYTPGVETLMWESIVAPNTYVMASSADDTFQAPIRLVETPQQIARPKLVGDQLNSVIAKYGIDFAQETKALEVQRVALITATAYSLHLIPMPSTAVSPAIDQQVADVLRRAEAERRLQMYSDYLNATLRPGLSPADRRLLFNHALVTLNLPLPAAIRRPIGPFQ